MSFEYTGFAAIPGLDAVRETFEASITFGPWEYNRAFVVPTIIDGATRDLGNDANTTMLRPGLMLGMIIATKKVTVFNSAAVDGTEDLYGILLWDVNTQQQGTDKDRWFGYALIGGNVKSKALINSLDAADKDPGGWIGGADEVTIRTGMSKRYILDDIGQIASYVY